MGIYLCRYLSISIYIYAAILIYIYIYIRNTATSVLQTKNISGKLLFVFCKGKAKVCFPWSANNNR